MNKFVIAYYEGLPLQELCDSIVDPNPKVQFQMRMDLMRQLNNRADFEQFIIYEYQPSSNVP